MKGDSMPAEPSEHLCSCGQAWHISPCAPTNRFDHLVCRCGNIIASGHEGSLSVSLASPRERFGSIRKLRYVASVALLRTANILKIKLVPSSCLRPHRIVAFRHTNTAVRTIGGSSLSPEQKRNTEELGCWGMPDLIGNGNRGLTVPGRSRLPKYSETIVSPRK